MDKKKIKNITLDLAADIVGSFLIAIGIYNFATASEFPVTGITGIAQVLYIYFGLPIGTMTTIINIPIILACVKVLGVKFVVKSLKTLLISNFFMDVVAPLLPIYEGDLMLSSICMGLFAGLGYALIFMRDSSTGGVDFISLTLRALQPHISLGRITPYSARLPPRPAPERRWCCVPPRGAAGRQGRSPAGHIPPSEGAPFPASWGRRRPADRSPPRRTAPVRAGGRCDCRRFPCGRGRCTGTAAGCPPEKRFPQRSLPATASVLWPDWERRVRNPGRRPAEYESKCA